MEAHLCFGLRINVILDLYGASLPLDYLWCVVMPYFAKASNFDLCGLNVFITRSRNFSCVKYFILNLNDAIPLCQYNKFYCKVPSIHNN